MKKVFRLIAALASFSRYNSTGNMSWLTYEVCHFVLGGGLAALRGEDPVAGVVISASVSEIVADVMIARALEQTRADVLEQLEDFRAEYGALPPVQDVEFLT